MARIPPYVSQAKREKEIARLENGTWKLFTRTSKRVKGEKYPIVIENAVAIATPSGRVDLASSIQPEIGNFVCYEFGYSFALQQLCPYNWKTSLHDDWESVLLDLIFSQSPTSYLKKERGEIVLPENRFVKIHQKRFWNKLPENTNERLQPLKYLQVAFFPDRVELSRPTEAQNAILAEFGLRLEGCVL